MLIPRRVKHRKQHHPGRSGAGGHDAGIRRLRHPGTHAAYVTNRQIRVRAYRDDPIHQAWWKGVINIYPDRPLTKKPAETRMGSGKGSPEWWIANVKPGRIMFEPRASAREVLLARPMRLAMHSSR